MNFASLLWLVGIQPYCYGCLEVRRVAEAVDYFAAGKFAVLLHLCGLLPCYCGWWGFHHVAEILGNFNFFATAAWNVALLLQLARTLQHSIQ